MKFLLLFVIFCFSQEIFLETKQSSCIKVTYGKEGDFCDYSQNKYCKAFNVCKNETKTCTKATIGSFCQRNEDCAYNLELQVMCIKGVCTKLRYNGYKCDVNEDVGLISFKFLVLWGFL